MKKAISCILILVFIFSCQHSFGQETQEGKIERLVKDPDWQLMTTIQDRVINSFVSSDVDISSFDFNNEGLFLKTIKMSKEEYLAQVKLNKEAANRLLKKYDLGIGNCQTCSMSSAEQIKGVRGALLSFQKNTAYYNKFRTQTLGVQVDELNTLSSLTEALSINKLQIIKPTFACCGLWFYACCTLCAITIEAFPVYLMCCSYCFHAECCSQE